MSQGFTISTSHNYVICTIILENRFEFMDNLYQTLSSRLQLKNRRHFSSEDCNRKKGLHTPHETTAGNYTVSYMQTPRTFSLEEILPKYSTNNW